MFSAILDSFPRQAREALYGRDGQQQLEPTNVQSQISQLEALGFGREDCAAALKAACDGSLDEAALWLTTHATPQRPDRRRKRKKKGKKVVGRSRTTSMQGELEPMQEEMSEEEQEDEEEMHEKEDSTKGGAKGRT